MTTGRFKGKAEHKYGYSALLAETPAYGWCSTAKSLGVWMINPSTEYIAGGPTKMELTGHLDGGRGGVHGILAVARSLFQIGEEPALDAFVVGVVRAHGRAVLLKSQCREGYGVPPLSPSPCGN